MLLFPRPDGSLPDLSVSKMLHDFSSRDIGRVLALARPLLIGIFES
jgi:hypothetical protein